MPVTVNTGVVDTEAVLADEKVVDMADDFKILDPDTSQFQTILDKLPSKVATREKVNWLEDEYFPNLSATAATAESSDATVDVTAGEGVYFRAGDLILVGTTGEKLQVVSISADELTVTRSIGDVAAASAASGVDLIIIGNVSTQNADTGTLKATQRVLGYNYTQIQRNPFGFSGTDIEIETYGSDDPENEIAKKAVEHRRALEHLSWFGARSFVSSTPNSYGTTGGVQEYISTNVFAAIGTLSLTSFDSKMQTIFQHGTLNKVIFAAPTPARALSNLLANNWVRARPEDRVYGAKVSGFVNGAYGENTPVIVKREWGRYSSTSDQPGSWVVVLDLSYVKKRPMRNRNTMLLPNRQNPGVDGRVWDYLTECSLEFSVERAHGLLTGITG
jgi:hypothetical protein